MHNLIATHKDGKSPARHDHPGACVSKATFNCQCENLISESPFVGIAHAQQILTAVPVAAYISSFEQDAFTAELLTLSLRGPPAC